MRTENFNTDFLKNNKNPFLVPSGYFKESRSQILEKIAGVETGTPVRKLNIRPGILWISGIAATLLSGIVLFQNLYIEPNRSIKMAQEMEWFINYSGSDLDVGTLASYVVDEGISFEDVNDEVLDMERSTLLELTDYDELSLIEEWMKSENQ